MKITKNTTIFRDLDGGRFGNFEANGIYWIGCRHFGRTTFRRILRKAGVTL